MNSGKRRWRCRGSARLGGDILSCQPKESNVFEPAAESHECAASSAAGNAQGSSTIPGDSGMYGQDLLHDYSLALLG